AVGAGVDGRVVEGLRVAGKCDLAGFTSNDGMRDDDGELRAGVRGLSELAFVCGARGDAPDDPDDQKQRDDGERDTGAFGGFVRGDYVRSIQRRRSTVAIGG